MPRIRINLNRDWRFIRSDAPDAALPATDDSAWQQVGLPHSFDLPYFRTPEFFVGVGWYCKTLHVPPEWIGRRVLLEFEAAFQVAEVYINDRRFGGHAGGYTAFLVDLTDAIHAGDNTLAVRVSNEWNPQIAPRAGEHFFSGGLYRDVHLLVVDPLHLAWRGVTITTPQATAESASVVVRTDVRNDSPQCRQISLRTELLDPYGRVIETLPKIETIEPGETRSVLQSTDRIDSPRLWHTDHPNLYQARQTLIDGGRVLDQRSTTFGIRHIEWTADRGFFLNGQHLYLHGANAHQDHAGWGIAITRAAIERDVRLLKECGMNFVRGAHYPHHPAFAEACDRLGMICWSEAPFWGKGGFGPEGYWNSSAFPVNEADFAGFEASAKLALAEMIRDNRNSPSVCFWSMTNEAFFSYHLPRVRKLISEMVSLSREIDPTRPAAVGGAQRGDVAHLGDVAGYNGDGARLFHNPGVPNMVSEYGAISKPHDAFDPFLGDLKNEPRYPWRAGEAVWCGFDYGTIAGKQGLKGIIDHFRLPKQSWQWYREKNLGIPAEPWPAVGTPAKLSLATDRPTIRGTDALEDAQIIVTLHDAAGGRVGNCPPVTLTIESGPGEFPTGRSITFDASTDIQIVGGRAGIAMRTYHGGTSVIRATSPGLADATMTITTFGEPGWIKGVTQPVAHRPYTPPPPSEAALRATKNAVNVARDRPSRASSFVEAHPPRLANDADGAATSWFASPDDASPSWTLDLEGFYELASDRLTFPVAANYRYLLHMSVDGVTWTLACDRSASNNASNVRINVYDPGTVARYLRVTLTHVPQGLQAGLAEVEVFGILSTR